MTRFVPMALLILGLGIATASGARLGSQHQAHRQAEWVVAHADEATPEALAAARTQIDEIGLPSPGARLSQWWSVGGLGWALGLMLVGVGAAGVRRQQKEAFSGASGASAGVDIDRALLEVERGLAEIAEAIAELPMDDEAPQARASIDALHAQHIEPVVDARGQLIARHGIGGFAEYFSPFSAGERQLNRCWSALADGHAVVAREALSEARASFGRAREAYAQAG